MAINRDLKIRVRANLILAEILESGKEGSQGHLVKSYPEISVDADEWDRRMSDASDVLLYGYELTGTVPPIAVTEEVGSLTKNSVVLKGRVTPNTNTSCGFLYGTTKELDNTKDADQSIIAASSDTPVPVTASLAGLTPGTKYYYRAWAQIALVNVRYGRLLSFTTPLV
jgi:hypothetical protein